MSNPTKTTADFTTFSIHTSGGQILIRDEDGVVIHTEPSDLTINASTNSHLIAGQLNAHIPGWLVDVEHDRDTIIVTTTELAWNRPMNWRFKAWGELVVKLWRDHETGLPHEDTRTDNDLMAALWTQYADHPGRDAGFAIAWLEECKYSAD